MAGPDSTATYNQEQRERLESEMEDLIREGNQMPATLMDHFLQKGYDRKEVSRAILEMIGPDEKGVRKFRVGPSWYLIPAK